MLKSPTITTASGIANPSLVVLTVRAAPSWSFGKMMTTRPLSSVIKVPILWMITSARGTGVPVSSVIVRLRANPLAGWVGAGVGIAVGTGEIVGVGDDVAVGIRVNVGETVGV